MPNLAMVAGSRAGATPADRVLYLAPLPEGPVTVLNGVAAVLVEELVSREAGTVAARLAARLGVPPDDLDDTAVEELAADLVARGLVQADTGTAGRPAR